jgi:hypothetical protein
MLNFNVISYPSENKDMSYLNNRSMTLNNNDIKKIVHDIQPRDFNLLDFNNNYKLSSLIIRKKSYLLKLNGIRAIVTTDKIYIFNNSNNIDFRLYKFILIQFEDQNIISKDLPFELKILELILIFICKNTDEKISELSNKVKNIIIEKINSSKHRQILSIQNELLNTNMLYEEIRIIIYNLMKSEEDMFKIYLSKKSIDPEKIDNKEKNKIDEFEILLENYENLIKEDACQVVKLIQEVESVLRLNEIYLAEFRNDIAIFNSRISIVTLCISFGALISSIFGMNLNNTFENNTGGLYICALIIMIICILIFVYVYNKLKKIIL